MARNSDHDEAVQRRLALLGEELSGLRTGPTEAWGMPDSHTRVRGRPDPDGPPPVERDLAPWPSDAEPSDIPAPGRHAHRWEGGGRLRPSLGRAPLAGVLALVVAALAGLCWWLLHTAAHPSAPVDLTPASAERHGLATPAAAVSAAPGATGGKVTVDVEGKVRRPGIVVLDAGARVIDAIKAAGGLRGSPRDTGLNLARVLVDGEQILVGVPAAAPGVPPAAATASASGALVNLNTADEAALEGLPEVGPVTAQSILDWRTQNGAFTSVQELLEVDGIGEATLDQLLPFVTV